LDIPFQLDLPRTYERKRARGKIRRMGIFLSEFLIRELLSFSERWRLEKEGSCARMGVRSPILANLVAPLLQGT
jgi:hypothetical protein